MRVYKTLLIVAILISVFKAFDVSYNAPYGRWDAWAIWNLRARYLFTNDFSQAFSPALQHTDYPVLIPGLVALGWKVIQQPHPIVPILLSLMFISGLTYLFYKSIYRDGLKEQAVILTVLLLLLPNFVFSGITQLADTPLAFFIFCTVVALEQLRQTQKSRWALLAGILTGCALWTKNEGILFLLVISLAYFTILIRPRNLIRFSGILLPFLIAYLYFKLAIVPPNDLINEQTGTTLEKIFSIDRYLIIGLAYLQITGIYFAVMGLLLFLPIKPTQLNHSQLPDLKKTYRPLLVAGLMLLGYFAIYLITPHELNWHLNSSLDRLIIHVLPVALFGLAPYIGWFSPQYYSVRQQSV